MEVVIFTDERITTVMSQISNNKLRDQTDACNFAVCNKDAIEAGRDGASAFKSVINTKGFAYAAERARKIIVSQCPEGYDLAPFVEPVIKRQPPDSCSQLN